MGVWLSLLSLHACPKASVAKTAELPHAILKFGEADCYPLQLYRACFGMTFWVWFRLFLCGFDEGKDLYGHLPGISGYHWCFKLDKHNIPIKTPAGHARGSWPFLQTNLKNKITKHEKHTDLNTKTRTKTPNTSFTMMLTHSAPVTLPRHGCRRPSIANTLLGSYPPPGNTCN